MDICLNTTSTDEALAHPLVVGLLEHVSDGAIVIDARTRQVIMMNPIARELLGYTTDEAVGCQCKRIRSGPACDQECPLDRMLTDGPRSAETRMYYLGKGARRVLHARTRFLLLRGPAGEPVAAVELFRDLREVEELREQLHERRALHHIIGRAEAMQQLYTLVEQIAPHDLPVLLTGESGVGKERFADAIHHLSGRALKPFVKVNCAALSTALVESELFGHRRGAFTGALEERVGRFEAADGGTILLDEIGELPMELQAKLLRVLQNGEVQRIGDARPRHVNVRIIGATNRDLVQDVARGRFRQDLYFRLLGAHLHIPPLRERPEDIPLLAEHFLAQHAPHATLSAAATRALLAHPWPGNVRELEHTLQLASIRAGAHATILPEHLQPTTPPTTPATHAPAPEPPLDLRTLEHQAITRAMRQAEGNITHAARLLGIDRSTLWRKLQRL